MLFLIGVLANLRELFIRLAPVREFAMRIAERYFQNVLPFLHAHAF